MSMVRCFHVPAKLPGLNEYTKACRSNPHAGAEMKREAEEVIGWCIKSAHVPMFVKPVHVTFTWHEAKGTNNRYRDPDNIAFAKKYVFDSLVSCYVLKDDSHAWVEGFTDKFEWLGKGDSCGVTVRIEEVEEEQW